MTLAEVQAQITAEAAACLRDGWSQRRLRPSSGARASAAPNGRVGAALYERSPDDIKKAIENSRAAREDARALLGIPEAGKYGPAARAVAGASRRSSGTRRSRNGSAIVRRAVPALTESAAAKPAILSERAERQVAAAFGELSEAFAARSKKTFDEMAEEMMRPMLQDWLDNNLPTLVERLVREEIERVARGAQ